MDTPNHFAVERTDIKADQSTTLTEFQRGQVIGGRYEVLSRLGKGGMGLVYRVKQIFLNRELALKTIDKNCMTESAIRRFQQEAQTAFSLDHPNIIGVKDFGVLDDQTPFLAMELVHGETLGDFQKRVGCLTVEQAIPIFIQVCFGLSYAHECGVVHRDIKPSNIMVLNGLPHGAEGSVKILDFGIAKFTAHEGGEVQALTRTGEIFGSPLYMSPEQCSGFRVDHRADVYSLGCVLFESLSGTPPFIGDNALATMMKHQNEPAPTLREASLGKEFPEDIEKLVAAMLAKSPEDRYSNLGVVAHQLNAIRHGASISSLPKSGRPVSQQNVSEISMSRARFVAIMLLISALSGSAGYLFDHLRGAVTVQESAAQATSGNSDREYTEELLKRFESAPAKSSTEYKLPDTQATIDLKDASDLLDRGMDAEAEPMLLQALIHAERQFGKKSVQVADVRLNLGRCYLDQRKIDEAKIELEQAHAIYQKSSGPDEGHLIITFTGLADCNMKLGNYAEAAQQYKRAAEISELVLGPNHPSLASNLYHLGRCYLIQGDVAKVAPLYKRALAIYDKSAKSDNSFQNARMASIIKEMRLFLQGESAKQDGTDITTTPLRAVH